MRCLRCGMCRTNQVHGIHWACSHRGRVLVVHHAACCVVFAPRRHTATHRIRCERTFSALINYMQSIRVFRVRWKADSYILCKIRNGNNNDKELVGYNGTRPNMIVTILVRLAPPGEYDELSSHCSGLLLCFAHLFCSVCYTFNDRTMFNDPACKNSPR